MRYLTILTIACLIIFSGCSPDIEKVEPQPEIPTTTEDPLLDDIDVPEDFGFTFTRKISLQINCLDTIGQVQPETPVWLYSDSPSNGGVQLAKGISGKDGVLVFEIEVARAIENLKAYTSNKGIPLTQDIDIAPKMRVFNWCTGTPRDPAGEFEDLLNDLLNQDQEEPNEDCPALLYHLNGRKLQRFNPLDGEFKTIGLASKAYNGIGISPANGLLYGIAYRSNAHYLWEINKDTGKETELGRISGNIGRNITAFDFDQLGRATMLSNLDNKWYLVRLPQIDDLKSEKIELTTNGEVSTIRDIVFNQVFENFYAIDINGNLIEIDPSQNTINNLGNIGSEIENSEIGSIWTDGEGALYLHQFKTGKVFGISLDTDGNLEGVGFVTQAKPSEGTNSASCALASLPFDVIRDTDTDGVPDILDETPEDSTTSVVNEIYLPGKGVFGTYAYEDRWPFTGDYDFNDMVVDYNYTFKLNPMGEVTNLFCSYLIRGVGATTTNGFAISFDNLRADQVENVERSWEIPTAMSPNGTEPGHQSGVFILFEDIHRFMGVNPGTMTNTIVGGTSVEPRLVSIKIDFKEPVSFEQFDIVNPFIYVDGDRGREIHLMGMEPTALASSNFFGTNQDRTDMGASVYYTSDRGLPWALNLPTSFAYPKERISVLETYPRFYSWINSGGTQDKEWYLRQNGIQGNIY